MSRVSAYRKADRTKRTSLWRVLEGTAVFASRAVQNSRNRWYDNNPRDLPWLKQKPKKCRADHACKRCVRTEFQTCSCGQPTLPYKFGHVFVSLYARNLLCPYRGACPSLLVWRTRGWVGGSGRRTDLRTNRYTITQFCSFYGAASTDRVESVRIR